MRVSRGYCMTCRGTCYSDEDGERLATDHRPGCAITTGDGICGRKWFDFTCTLPKGHASSHQSEGNYLHTDESDRCPWCEGSGYRTAYGPLQHLVLSWAARSLLTMTEGWRDRQVLMLGKPVNEATDEAANLLYEQGFLVNLPGNMISHGGINLTDAGRDQLAEWDRLAAGVQ